MSNGDEAASEEDETTTGTGTTADEEDGDTVSDHLATATESLEDEDPVAAIEVAIDSVSDALDAASTEHDLDEIEATIDEIASTIDEADLPEPDDEEADPAEELTDQIDALEEQIEGARGPYASDVIDAIEDASGTISNTRWTENGGADVIDAVSSFLDDARSVLGEPFGTPSELEDCEQHFTGVSEAIETADFDPDEDAETIARLLDMTDELENRIEDAEEWDDLLTREQLQAQGFYDVLDHQKDYPPEWHAIKVWEKRGNAEMVLLALEKLGSEFMEEHCLDALERMGPAEAIDPMLERAARRDQPAIRILGKIGSTEALETIQEYAGADADDALRRVALKAVGEIGSNESTETVAQGLSADSESVRSAAARALGLIGDPRAIAPLESTLEEAESQTVRASAAWALIQIGTEGALEAVGSYAGDDSPLVRAEAQRAEQAIDV